MFAFIACDSNTSWKVLSGQTSFDLLSTLVSLFKMEVGNQVYANPKPISELGGFDVVDVEWNLEENVTATFQVAIRSFTKRSQFAVSIDQEIQKVKALFGGLIDSPADIPPETIEKLVDLHPEYIRSVRKDEMEKIGKLLISVADDPTDWDWGIDANPYILLFDQKSGDKKVARKMTLIRTADGLKIYNLFNWGQLPCMFFEVDDVKKALSAYGTGLLAE